MDVKPQINVDYGQERVRRINAAAEARGMARPDYLRWLADGALAAHDAGRDPFMSEPAALTARDIAEHRAAVMEMARIAEEWSRQASALRKLERDDQALLSKARSDLMGSVPERIKKTLEPFRNEIRDLSRSIEEQPRLDTIAEEQAALRLAQERYADALSDHTKAMEAAMKIPRTQYALVLGDDRFWSAAFVAAWSLVMAVLGGVIALNWLG